MYSQLLLLSSIHGKQYSILFILSFIISMYSRACSKVMSHTPSVFKHLINLGSWGNFLKAHRRSWSICLVVSGNCLIKLISFLTAVAPAPGCAKISIELGGGNSWEIVSTLNTYQRNSTVVVLTAGGMVTVTAGFSKGKELKSTDTLTETLFLVFTKKCFNKFKEM